MGQINDVCKKIHAWAHSKKFYPEQCSPPCKHISGCRAAAIMLVVTELGEAVEADRKSDYVNFNEEIADAVIRLFDLCAAEGIDLERELVKKMNVNADRPEKHGKKY